MRYYHYGNINNSESEKEKNNLKGCFITDMDNININNVYNSSLIIDDDTVYEIDEECIRCRK